MKEPLGLLEEMNSIWDQDYPMMPGDYEFKWYQTKFTTRK
jgi:hypothetical protein